MLRCHVKELGFCLLGDGKTMESYCFKDIHIHGMLAYVLT